MKKPLKITLIIVICIIVFLAAAMVIYKAVFSMGIAEQFESGNANSAKKVLIASQGSKFKNTLTKTVVKQLNEKNVFVKVIDVTNLDKINENDFQAILIIHTIEAWDAPKTVVKFLGNTRKSEKILLVATSGRGTYKAKNTNIDTITSASKMDKIDSISVEIIARLDKILK